MQPATIWVVDAVVRQYGLDGEHISTMFGSDAQLRDAPEPLKDAIRLTDGPAKLHSDDPALRRSLLSIVLGLDDDGAPTRILLIVEESAYDGANYRNEIYEGDWHPLAGIMVPRGGDRLDQDDALDAESCAISMIAAGT